MVGDVDNGGGCTYVEAGAIWEISETSAQFHCEPKTALKKKKSKSRLILFTHYELVQITKINTWLFLSDLPKIKPLIRE